MIAICVESVSLILYFMQVKYNDLASESTSIYTSHHNWLLHSQWQFNWTLTAISLITNVIFSLPNVIAVTHMFLGFFFFIIIWHYFQATYGSCKNNYY